ncbi:hypothetical protein AB1K89_06125 [Sporosarcina sp. 179-K 8C2 HS]|uniref:hypothetical protein n=1 Tax=Sporosarcina sp. 179-K 8C2 HS TaxID=3142387 RepID=UPI0039A30193
MSKTLLILIAGILSAWLVIGFFTKNYDGDFLIILLFGVLVGYGVRKREEKY